MCTVQCSTAQQRSTLLQVPVNPPLSSLLASFCFFSAWSMGDPEEQLFLAPDWSILLSRDQRAASDWSSWLEQVQLFLLLAAAALSPQPAPSVEMQERTQLLRCGGPTGRAANEPSRSSHQFPEKTPTNTFTIKNLLRHACPQRSKLMGGFKDLCQLGDFFRHCATSQRFVDSSTTLTRGRSCF